MTKIAGSGSASGSISQRHGSADPDPDPHQNAMDPEHCLEGVGVSWGLMCDYGGTGVLGARYSVRVSLQKKSTNG
jgi:hypothetical protein